MRVPLLSVLYILIHFIFTLVTSETGITNVIISRGRQRVRRLRQKRLNILSPHFQKVVEPEFYFILHTLDQYCVLSTGSARNTVLGLEDIPVTKSEVIPVLKELILEYISLKIILGTNKFYGTNYTKLWIESIANIIHTYF